MTIAFLPKSKGNAYFLSCAKGAQKAADELGVELIFDGPTDPDPARQNEIVENWITLGVNAIAAACENKEGISTALRKAQVKGIKVITYDADALPDARSFFVDQATPQGIGYALMDEAARRVLEQPSGRENADLARRPQQARRDKPAAGQVGEFAVITGSLTAENQTEWRKYVEERRAAAYPNMKTVAVEACDDLKDKAQSETTALLSTYPNLKLILSTTSLGVPGAAEAIKQAGKTGIVKNIGLGLPNENRRYVHDGVTQGVILWKTEDLGYLTVYAADALAKGTLKSGDKTFKAGSLGTFEIQGDNIMLRKPFTFNKDNIDQFDF